MANPHLEGGKPWWPSTYSSPIPAQPVATGTPNFGGQGTGGANQPPIVDTPIVDTPVVDRNIIQEGIGSLGGALHGDEIYQPKIVNNYDVLDAFTDLSKIHGQTGLTGAAGQHDLTKYGKSWDFNPDNPDNLIGMDTHTLGSFIAVDSSGNPMLDSSGNPVFTSFGKALHDDMQGQGLIGPEQSVGDPSALQDYIDTFSFDEIHDMEKDYWRDSFDQGWYGMDDWDYNYYGGGPGETETTLLGGPWSADPLPTEMASMGEMKPIYGEELDPNREASWLYLTGTPQFRDRTIYS